MRWRRKKCHAGSLLSNLINPSRSWDRHWGGPLAATAARAWTAAWAAGAGTPGAPWAAGAGAGATWAAAGFLSSGAPISLTSVKPVEKQATI